MREWAKIHVILSEKAAFLPVMELFYRADGVDGPQKMERK